MQKIFFKNVLSLLTIIYIFCLSGEVGAENEKGALFKEVMCKSTTIRTVKDFKRLQNCTVVTGYVRIVEVEFTPAALEEVKSSNIEEISEYLLVYRAEGLDSLERLFPKLIVIRGVELLYDQYALIILENRDLKNIGLVSLLRVLKGSIRVEFNPSLCFAQTINWVWILGNTTKEYFYAMKNNKPPSQCPLCYTYDDELETIEVNRHKKCWSTGKFQKTSLDYIDGKECYKQGAESSCWSLGQFQESSLEHIDGKRCYKQGGESSCLTSCTDSNCRHCTNFVSDTGCVVNCLPPKYRLAFKRQCVTNCAHWGLINMGMECVEKCPKHYQEVQRNGVISCALNCTGNFIVHNAEDLEGLADCTTITGSLTIELYETDKPIVEHLEKAFRNLNEITGYLKILNSPQIVSLHFFKHLHTIRGSELLENMYSLYVVDNNYLQELWVGNVAIIHGCIYFHLNPRLCYEKIADLQKNFKECRKITIKDVSINSNGERVVCGEDVQVINTTVKDLNSTSALIELDLLPGGDLYLLIGYIYYYKEAPNRNVTKYDGRHGCGSDSWFTETILTNRRRHILNNLKPATQYAYFVNSMTFLDYPHMAEHVSEIQYFQTLPSKPGMVAKLYSHSLSAKTIEVHWWPPRITNGIIEKYILQYEVTNTTISYEPIDQTEECQCPKLDTESTVPTPHAENYYNKEQLLYRDAIMNFFLVRKESSDDTAQSEVSSSEIKESYLKFLQKLELQNIKKQEEGKESYFLTHPLPVCYSSNPNAQDQTENKCTRLEKFEDAIEIPGNRHTYILSSLEPEKTYRISLRACVKDLANGCGAEKVMLAETVSKRIETIIENFKLHKM